MQKIIVFMAFILLSPAYFTFAGIEINEIMYDLKTGSDDGREWIEVYNNGSETVDFSTYKFFEAETNHKLSLVSGSAKLEPYSYVLIVSDFAKFKIDWPNLSASIFDSTFSLNNGGESIAIRNEEDLIDKYFYNTNSGGAGDGKSLQKINGAWQSATPTPGRENKITIIPKSDPLPSKKVSSNIQTVAESGVSQAYISPEIWPENNFDLSPSPTSKTHEKSSNSLISFAILPVFLSFAAGSVYFIRKKKIISKTGDDFELID